jgi:hypothetical protein
MFYSFTRLSGHPEGSFKGGIFEGDIVAVGAGEVRGWDGALVAARGALPKTGGHKGPIPTSAPPPPLRSSTTPDKSPEGCPTLGKFDYAANVFPFQHVRIGFIDLVERVSACHQLVELDLASLVQGKQVGNIVAWL